MAWNIILDQFKSNRAGAWWAAGPTKLAALAFALALAALLLPHWHLKLLTSSSSGRSPGLGLRDSGEVHGIAVLVGQHDRVAELVGQLDRVAVLVT